MTKTGTQTMWFCLHPFFTVTELSLSHSLAQKRATSLPEWLFFVFVSEFSVEGEGEEGDLGEEGEGERRRGSDNLFVVIRQQVPANHKI